MGTAVALVKQQTGGDKSDALAVLTAFERRLAGCKTLGEVKALRDEAETMRHYAKTARKGVEAQNACAIARLLAERRIGEMLAALPRTPGPGRGKRVAAGDESFLKVLEAEGFTYPCARRWQRFARVPEDMFRTALADARCRPSDEDPATSSCISELTEDSVANWVDWYVHVHVQVPQTPAEEAREERRRAAAAARVEAELAREAALRKDRLNRLWGRLNSALAEADLALLDLRVHVPAVGEVATLLDQMLELLHRIEAARLRALTPAKGNLLDQALAAEPVAAD